MSKILPAFLVTILLLQGCTEEPAKAAIEANVVSMMGVWLQASCEPYAKSTTMNCLAQQLDLGLLYKLSNDEVDEAR